MNTEELTPIVTSHQTAITRHDLEMAEIRTILNRVAERQEANIQQIEANSHQIALNREGISELRASILDLRNIVADYIEGRSQL